VVAWRGQDAAFFARGKTGSGISAASAPGRREAGEIGKRCHELRIKDEPGEFRIVYRVDSDAIVILEVFKKTARTTPRRILEICRERLKRYDAAVTQGRS
jgi:phage-related protein